MTKRFAIIRVLFENLPLLLPFFLALSALWLREDSRGVFIISIIVLGFLPLTYAALLDCLGLARDADYSANAALEGSLSGLWFAVFAAMLVINYDGDLNLPIGLLGGVFFFSISVAYLFLQAHAIEPTIERSAVVLATFRCIGLMMLLLLLGLLYGAGRNDLCKGHENLVALENSAGGSPPAGPSLLGRPLDCEKKK